jgi:hypothetical protein
MSRDARSQSFRALNKPCTISRSGWFDKALSEDDANSIHPAMEVVLYPACQALGRIQEEDLLMPTDLQLAYQDVLDRFNLVDYPGLMRVIDPDIIAKRVLKPGSIVGIGNIETYLLRHMAPLSPSFENVVPTFYPSTPAAQATAISGHVRGTGDYYDDNVTPGGRVATPVHFVWIFTRSNTKEEWLLIHIFGCPI